MRCGSFGQTTISDPGTGKRLSHLGRGACATLEYGFEDGPHLGYAFCAKDEIPQWLELFPSGGIREMAQAAGPGGLGYRTFHDHGPAIEVAVGAPVSLLQLLGR